MIIARAPLRISFLGGGTDYPEYYENSDVGGAVLGTTINQYVYVMISKQPEFEKVRFRVTYRKTDAVADISEISHPAVRASLQKRNWQSPLNIATMASLPGRSGLGSSSAFTVALNYGLDILEKTTFKNEEDHLRYVADFAILIERDELGEAGGHQDQYHAAFGGFRLYEFSNAVIKVNSRIMKKDFIDLISKSLVLVAGANSRDSSTYAKVLKDKLIAKEQNEAMISLTQITKNAYKKILSDKIDVESKMVNLIEAMRQGWELKLSTGVSIDEGTSGILKAGMNLGAYAWKLCGSGGTGFAAFLAPPEQKRKFIDEFGGSRIVFPELTDKGLQYFEA